MTVTLPAEYAWGFVTGKIIHARGDQAPDADRYPEATAAVGTVRFTPSTRTRRASDALVMHETVVCSIGADGLLTDAENQPGVWLIEGVYRVEFSLTAGTYPAFDISVSAAHTLAAPLDLAAAAPYVPPTGIPAGPMEGYVLGWSGGALAWVAGGSGSGGGGGVTEVSGVVTLPADGPRLLEMYTVGSATINGETFAVDTALVARRTAADVWQVAVVDSADWRAFSAVPTVTATAPTFTDQSGTGSDTYTLPTKANVIYKVAGATKAAGTYPGSGTVTVTAEAASGYTLTGTTSWSHTFSTATAPTPVTATAPTWTDNTVDGGGTWTTPTITGVSYSPASGTATPGQAVTVTATAQAGYTLSGTSSWTHGFPATPAPWTGATDNFVDAPDGSLVGRTTQTGGLTWANVDKTVFTSSRDEPGEALGGKMVKGKLGVVDSRIRSIELDYTLSTPGTSLIRVAVGSSAGTPVYVIVTHVAMVMYKAGVVQQNITGLASLGAANLRVVRSGTTVTAYRDDVQIFTHDVGIAPSPIWGMYVGNDATQATFDNVEFLP